MVSRLAYRDQSRAYLEQANEELAKEDLLQASEKGWGAASQIVKAVAEERVWEHRGHWYLHRAVDSLVAETSDDEIQAQFSSANSLHINFYEGLLSRDTVAFHIRQVTRFIEKVEALLDQGR